MPLVERLSQKAPSAKRCIKTSLGTHYGGERGRCVRKHRAPKGALRPVVDGKRLEIVQNSQKAPSAKRCIKTLREVPTHRARCPCVRKHRAPKGALRRKPVPEQERPASHGQKAPSAKRCIKTTAHHSSRSRPRAVRKHRAPKGALRRNASLDKWLFRVECG